MTGEITLRKGLPIGGLKEKLLAALRSGITKVIIPKENEDLEDIPSNVKKSLKIVLLKTSWRFDRSLTKKITPIDWKEKLF